MAGYAVNDKVKVQIGLERTVGKLVDVDILHRKFKVETEHGSFWIVQSQIIERIT